MTRYFIWVLLGLCLVRNVIAQEESLPRRVEEGLKKGGDVVVRGIKEGADTAAKGIKQAGKWVSTRVHQGVEKLDKAGNK